MVADRLSEANHSVLLLERGPASFGRWMPASAALTSVPDNLAPSGFPNWRPGWLNGTNLTRFDVPGLAQRIYADGAHVNCSDVVGPLIAGCLLGGSMAVNAALWWRAPAADWDVNFAGLPGWNGATDMAAAADAVFARLPGTDRPSADGRLAPAPYDGGWAPVAAALTAAGWHEVRANKSPDDKRDPGTFSYPNFFLAGGERGGPHATYLASAAARPRELFRLVTDTMVRRVVRDGARATGVEVEPSGGGAGRGLCAGVINVTSGRGRVVLSGGYFGTAKMLFRSGIGPAAQLRVVRAAEEAEGVEEGVGDASQWLLLPVGEGLRDHTVTAVQISHPDVPQYDYTSDAAYFSPPLEQREAYLTNRTGMCESFGPEAGFFFFSPGTCPRWSNTSILLCIVTVTGNYQAPISWFVVNGSDGLERQIQTTCRVYGATPTSMTCSQFLTRGSTSSGTLTITPDLKMNISVSPYATTAGDRSAIVEAMKTFLSAIRKNPEITITQPAENVTVEEYVANVSTTMPPSPLSGL